MPRRLTPSRVASGAVGRKPASTARPRHGPLVLRATRPGPTASIADDDTELFILSNGTVDYYAVLQVDDDASEAEIKAAYRNLAKICHPDFLGDAGHNICILLNEAYEVLMNPLARQAFNAQLEVALQDEEDGYTGEILSKWMPTVKPKMAKNTDPQESRAVFVDELSCIGCKMCVWCASATFRINPEHGRSRVFAQWLDTEEKIQQSIDSCPVDCIHWVDKEDLPALEYVCRFKTERVNVAHMMSNQGSNQDVFAMTEKFLKERRELEKRRQTAAHKASPMQEAARRKAAQEMAQRSSWFSMMGQQFADSFLGRGAAQSGDRNEPRVGRRKRARRSQPEEAILGGAGGTIPMERALVPCNRAEDI